MEETWNVKYVEWDYTRVLNVVWVEYFRSYPRHREIEFINQIRGRKDDASFSYALPRKKSRMINSRVRRDQKLSSFVSRTSSLNQKDFIFHLDIHCFGTSTILY